MSRTISSMIAEVRSQRDEVRGFVERLRNANRHLTGATGETPTKLADVRAQNGGPTTMTPLLEDLNIELESLNSATADLRDEIGFLETVSETCAPTEATYAAAKASAVGSYRA